MTQVFGENTIPFQHGRLRKVVIQEGLNDIVRMGSSKQKSRPVRAKIASRSCTDNGKGQTSRDAKLYGKPPVRSDRRHVKDRLTISDRDKTPYTRAVETKDAV